MPCWGWVNLVWCTWGGCRAVPHEIHGAVWHSFAPSAWECASFPTHRPAWEGADLDAKDTAVMALKIWLIDSKLEPKCSSNRNLLWFLQWGFSFCSVIPCLSRCCRDLCHQPVLCHSCHRPWQCLSLLHVAPWPRSTRRHQLFSVLQVGVCSFSSQQWISLRNSPSLTSTLI